MSFLANAVKGITALGVASQLGPAVAVDMTIDMIAGAVVCIIMLICCLAIFKIQDAKDSSGKSVQSTAQGYAIGFLAPIISGIAIAVTVHHLRWNMANPSYFAAEEGMEALFGHH
jgi:cellobiose-specific phosphotransferase system component IIC